MAPLTEVVEGWTGLEPEFELTGVRIVATLGNNGGAIVENLRKLVCSEGRLYSYEAELHTLEYNFSFAETDDGDPMASQSVRGRIVITGNHTNGHRIEIRGNGWIGYDEGGKIEGRFEKPPVMITEDWEPELDEEEAEQTEAKSSLIFPMPPQYVQATVRVPDDHSDWFGDDD